MIAEYLSKVKVMNFSYVFSLFLINIKNTYGFSCKQLGSLGFCRSHKLPSNVYIASPWTIL